MNWKDRRFKLTCTSVIAIVLVAVSTMQLSSMVLPNGNVVYAYSNSQAQSLVNECGVGDSADANCGIVSPQIQADGTAISPILSLSGGQGEQGPPGPQQAPNPNSKSIFCRLPSKIFFYLRK